MRAFEVLRSYKPVTKSSVHESFHEHFENPHRWLSGDAILSLYDLFVTLIQEKNSQHLPPLSFDQLSHKHREDTAAVPQNGESSCLLVFDAVDSQLVCPGFKDFLRKAAMPTEEETQEEDSDDDHDDDSVEILSSEILEHRVMLQCKLVHMMRRKQSFTIVGPLNVVSHWVLLTVDVRFDQLSDQAPSVFVYIDDPQSYNKSQVTCGDFIGNMKMYSYLSNSIREFMRKWADFNGDLLIYSDIIAHGIQDDLNTTDCGVHCVNMMLATTVVHAYKFARPMRYGKDDISYRDMAYYNSATIGNKNSHFSTELLRYVLALFVCCFKMKTIDPDCTALASWLHYSQVNTVFQPGDILATPISQFIDNTVINILEVTELARTKRLISNDYKRLRQWVKRSYSEVTSSTKPSWSTFELVWNIHVDYDGSYQDCLISRKHLTHQQILEKSLELNEDVPESLIKFVLSHCLCTKGLQ